MLPVGKKGMKILHKVVFRLLGQNMVETALKKNPGPVLAPA